MIYFKPQKYPRITGQARIFTDYSSKLSYYANVNNVIVLCVFLSLSVIKQFFY